jgi:hypothetical protein
MSCHGVGQGSSARRSLEPIVSLASVTRRLASDASPAVRHHPVPSKNPIARSLGFCYDRRLGSTIRKAMLPNASCSNSETTCISGAIDRRDTPSRAPSR